MKVRALLLVAALLTVLTPLQADGQPRRRGAAPRVLVTAHSVFGGNLIVRAGAPAESARVDIRQWSIAGGQRLAQLRLPFRGLMIVELRAGAITTIINGERVERREGEIWSVPGESTMQLETGDDTAILHTTLIGG